MNAHTHTRGSLSTTTQAATTMTKQYAKQIDSDGIDGNAQQTVDAGSVKKGKIVQLKFGGQFYVADGYCRFNKKYMFTNCDDISRERGLKKTAQVFAD